MRKSFAFTFKGKRVTGTAEMDSKGYFITDTIELSEDIKKHMNEIENALGEEAYWNYVDKLCEAMDDICLFDKEVNSIHIV